MQANGQLEPEDFGLSETGYNCMAQYIARTITVGVFARLPKTNPCGCRRPTLPHRRRTAPKQAQTARYPRCAALKPADTASCSEQNQRSPRAFCTRTRS